MSLRGSGWSVPHEVPDGRWWWAVWVGAARAEGFARSEADAWEAITHFLDGW